jgi:hypothetical protein
MVAPEGSGIVGIAAAHHVNSPIEFANNEPSKMILIVRFGVVEPMRQRSLRVFIYSFLENYDFRFQYGDGSYSGGELTRRASVNTAGSILR